MDELQPEDIIELNGPNLDALMDNVGLTPAKLIKRLKQKLDATEVKAFSYQGYVSYSKRLKALSIQLQALDMALKLRKMYPAEKRELSGPNGGPIEVAGKMDTEGLKRAIERTAKKPE
jgi:hypothetical protein